MSITCHAALHALPQKRGAVWMGDSNGRAPIITCMAKLNHKLADFWPGQGFGALRIN